MKTTKGTYFIIELSGDELLEKLGYTKDEIEALDVCNIVYNTYNRGEIVIQIRKF